jgi:transposase-like protein
MVRLEEVCDKWDERYSNAMKSWLKNWDVISPIFKFSADVRKVIYTTYTEEIIMPMFSEKPLIKGICRKISA